MSEAEKSQVAVLWIWKWKWTVKWLAGLLNSSCVSVITHKELDLGSENFRASPSKQNCHCLKAWLEELSRSYASSVSKLQLRGSAPKTKFSPRLRWRKWVSWLTGYLKEQLWDAEHFSSANATYLLREQSPKGSSFEEISETQATQLRAKEQAFKKRSLLSFSFGHSDFQNYWTLS